MRTSLFFLALTAATILAASMAAGPMAIGDVAPANAIRVAANICGNTGCYAPQVQRIQHRKFQTLGRPPGQPLGQPAVQSLLIRG
jgi:hypothetical protein